MSGGMNWNRVRQETMIYKHGSVKIESKLKKHKKHKKHKNNKYSNKKVYCYKNPLISQIKAFMENMDISEEDYKKLNFILNTTSRMGEPTIFEKVEANNIIKSYYNRR